MGERSRLFNVNCTSDDQEWRGLCAESGGLVAPSAKALKKQWSISHPGKGGALDFWEGLFLSDHSYSISLWSPSVLLPSQLYRHGCSSSGITDDPDFLWELYSPLLSWLQSKPESIQTVPGLTVLVARGMGWTLWLRLAGLASLMSMRSSWGEL